MALKSTPKGNAKAKTPKSGKKSVPPKAKQPEPVEEEDSSEESSSEEETNMPPKGNLKGSDESNSEGSSDEEMQVDALNGKGNEDDDDDDDSEEEDSDEEEPVAKKAPKKAAAVKQQTADDSDEEDDDDDEEEVEGDESEDDEEEEDDESGDDEVANVSQKRKKEEKQKPAKKAKVEAVEEKENLTLFCGNLAKGMDSSKLQKFFKKAGVQVTEVRHNDKKPFGYVDLPNKEELEKALALNGKKLEDQAIRIEKSKPKTQSSPFPSQNEKEAKTQERRKDRSEEDERTMFVKNLPEDCTKEMLEDTFPSAKSIRIPMKDDRPKGFAFLEFESSDKLDKVMEEKQGFELEGKALLLDYSGSKSTFKSNTPQRGQQTNAGEGKTLFVKNLSYDVNNDALKEHFDGAVDARVVFDKDSGRSKGYGYVDFESNEDAKKSQDAMMNSELEGRKLFIDFANSGGSRGGFGGGRGRGGFGGRGGGFGGRGGGRGGGFGGRGGGRGGGFGGRGGGRGGGFGGRGGGRGGGFGGRGRGGGDFKGKRDGIKQFEGSKKKFDD